jgi:REP element-mobilizing transposase RayT
MSRRLRFVPPGSLVEVTCRTVQGRLLLRPSPLLTELTLGVLARAARLYPVQVHGYVFLSNHFHLLLTVESAQRLATFMNYLNSNLAREAGRLIRWREKFWGRRYQAILVTAEEEDQVARLRYLLAHGTKEGLVASPLDWPGAHCAHALVNGSPVQGRWHDRTLEFKARRGSLLLDPRAFVEVETLSLAPIPAWSHCDAEEYRERIQSLVRDIESAARTNAEANGRMPLGRQALLLQDPHLEPNRIKRGPAPLAHAASAAARRSLRRSYATFLAAYRAAAASLRAGVLEASFPVGSFPPALPFRSG